VKLSVIKQVTQKLDTERFNLKKLNEVEDKEQYQVKTSNDFAAFENFDHNMHINIA
jgi:hypothetical protein